MPKQIKKVFEKYFGYAKSGDDFSGSDDRLSVATNVMLGVQSDLIPIFQKSKPILDPGTLDQLAGDGLVYFASDYDLDGNLIPTDILFHVNHVSGEAIITAYDLKDMSTKTFQVSHAITHITLVREELQLTRKTDVFDDREENFYYSKIKFFNNLYFGKTQQSIEKKQWALIFAELGRPNSSYFEVISDTVATKKTQFGLVGATTTKGGGDCSSYNSASTYNQSHMVYKAIVPADIGDETSIISIEVNVLLGAITGQFWPKVRYRSGKKHLSGSYFQDADYFCGYAVRTYFWEKHVRDFSNFVISTTEPLVISAAYQKDGNSIDVRSINVTHFDSSSITFTVQPDVFNVFVGKHATIDTVNYNDNLVIGVSKIYDNNQESGIAVVGEFDNKTAPNRVPYWIFAIEKDAVTDDDIRMVGYNIWIQKEDVDTFYLLAACNFISGECTFMPTGEKKLMAYDPVQDAFVVNIIKDFDYPFPSLSYQAKNGHSWDRDFFRSSFTFESWVNNRLYIAATKIKNAQQQTVLDYDSVIRSFANQPNKFIYENRLEIIRNDGYSVTALRSYADRLLIFKQNITYIVNVAQDVEFVENQLENVGVESQNNTVETPYGIFWFTRRSFFHFNGKGVRDVLQNEDGSRRLNDGEWNLLLASTDKGLLFQQLIYIDEIKGVLICHSSLGNTDEVSILYDIVNDAIFTLPSHFRHHTYGGEEEYLTRQVRSSRTGIWYYVAEPYAGTSGFDLTPSFTNLTGVKSTNYFYPAGPEKKYNESDSSYLTVGGGLIGNAFQACTLALSYVPTEEGWFYVNIRFGVAHTDGFYKNDNRFISLRYSKFITAAMVDVQQLLSYKTGYALAVDILSAENFIVSAMILANSVSYSGFDITQIVSREPGNQWTIDDRRGIFSWHPQRISEALYPDIQTKKYRLGDENRLFTAYAIRIRMVNQTNVNFTIYTDRGQLDKVVSASTSSKMRMVEIDIKGAVTKKINYIEIKATPSSPDITLQLGEWDIVYRTIARSTT